MTHLKPIWAAAALCLSLLGCSSSPKHGAGLGLGDGGLPPPFPTGDGCETFAEGCACENEGQLVDCGQVERVSGDYVSCSMGQRACSEGKWRACVGDHIATLHLPAGQRSAQALGHGAACPDNPCDPYCRIVVDDPQDLPLPDGGALSNDGGLQLIPHEESVGAGACTAMLVKPTPQAVTVTALAAGAQQGLLGEYFNQVDPNASQIPAAWVPHATRNDANIDFNWDIQLTPPGTLDDQFSVRWTGKLVAPTSEQYTFCTQTDDGSRLWIDDVLVVDSWFDHGAFQYCGAPRGLLAGSVHTVRLEYYDAYANASTQLRWSTPTRPNQVVPPSAFVIGGSSLPTLSATPQFEIELSPPGCFSGTPEPAWTLDRLDIATIDNSGKVGLIAAVAGPITATAYLGKLSAKGVVDVTIDIADTSAAPTGSVTTFQSAAGAADNAPLLYPYDQTVFPIGLRAPRIQWDNQLSDADAVKVGLRYPETGTAIFNWSQIIPETSPGQATIPAPIWKAFEQSAKGQRAAFSLQRIVAGQLRQATTRRLDFSSAPVRGRIYYTQYHRGGDASEMVADPGSEDPAQPAFASNDGCPVCHTLSASGNVFATSSRSGLINNDYASPSPFSATLGGISAVNGNGSLTPIADFVGNPPRPNYTGGSVDWRGFAWAPLSANGKFALAANNVWGNTRETVVGIDTTSRQVNTGSAMLSGGTGTGLLAQYYATTDASFATPVWKRIDPQLNFDFGAASPGGLVPMNFSVKRSGQIQAYFSQTYHFEVLTTSSDVFSLTVDGTTVGPVTGPVTLGLDVPLVAGSLVPIELKQQNPTGNSNVQLFWSSPATPRALVPQSQLFPPATEPVHGVNVVYNDGARSSSVIEPDIASKWVSRAPAPGMAVDNWTSTWDAEVESPYSGALELCVDSDGGVNLSLDGVPLINAAAGYNNCVAAGTWVFGARHSLHIEHTELTGDAHLVVKYQYGGVSEIIPTSNLYPKTPPASVSGLTATYYDLDAFNVGLPATQTNPRAFQRVDPNIDFDWATGRPNYSIISDDEQYSARWTGHIILPCAGVYEFRSNGAIDDGGRLWVDEQRVMARWDYGQESGAGYFEAGTHDFKFDWYQGTMGAAARLEWKTPCPGSPGWVTIPSGSFTPNANYTRTTGFIVAGGDNGNNTSYWVWQLPTQAAPTPVDVTPSSRGNWGLAGQVMMVPSFSPDNRKLVFIDGDSAGGAGWRKGLSTLEFDETAQLFKNRRLISSTWPLGDALKWPTFESDSRSVIFQTTVPGDSCCRNTWTKYGYMGPTNYYEDPGRLWSVDTQASAPAPVELARLNQGERAKDANKSYQATMLPVAAGGYRWVVFTSTRPYGNTLNLPAIQQDFSDTASYGTSAYTGMTNFKDIQSQLWIAAVDDATSGAADRSHPAFWLPSQNFASSASTGYINERGYWGLDACHPAGRTATASCEVDEDCCGGTDAPKTAACRLDIPIVNPPTRHCTALSGQCASAGKSCAATSDCCMGLACLGALCAAPPAVKAFSPQNYERIYESDCPSGTKVVWRFFDWKTVTPATGSRLEIFAETQADATQFSTLPVAPNAVSAEGVVHVWTVSGAPVTTWTGYSVDPLLVDKMLKSQNFLKITVRFVPNDERTASPVLTDWRQSYSCVPAE